MGILKKHFFKGKPWNQNCPHCWKKICDLKIIANYQILVVQSKNMENTERQTFCFDKLKFCRWIQTDMEIHVLHTKDLFSHGALQAVSTTFWSQFGKYCTVADYRRFTVRLQLTSLVPCILLLTPEIEVIYY